MGNRSMFVGLDVHKETIDVSVAEGHHGGEVRHYGVIASDLEPLDKVVRALSVASAPTAPARGYAPCRALRQRIKAVKWLQVPRFLPQPGEVLLVERCPFGHQSHRPGR